MEPVRLPELVHFVGIPKSALDEICSEEHARTISLKFHGWRRIAPHLGLGEDDIQTIEIDSKTEPERRFTSLMKWREKYAFKATIRKLVEALLITGNAGHAQIVCESLHWPKKAIKRQRELTDSMSTGSPASKRSSPLYSLHLQFPSTRALDRFLKTKHSVWVYNREVVFIRQSNQPQVAATTAKRADIEFLLPRNRETHTIVLLPALLRQTQPGSCRFAELCSCCYSNNICTTELPGPGAVLPTNKDICAIVSNETSHECNSSLTNCNEHILAVCVGDLDNIQENTEVNMFFDPENINSANFLSVAADEFLKFFETNPSFIDVPSAIHKFVSLPHPFPTPPYSPCPTKDC